MRRHPVFGDSVIAAAIAAFDLSALTNSFTSHYPLAYWSVFVLMLVPLVFRRKQPLLVAYVVAAGGVVQLLTHGSVNDHYEMIIRPADLALAISLYTLVVYVGRKPALLYAGILLVGTAIFLIWRIAGLSDAAALGIGALLIFGFSWVLGEFVGARRAYDAEVRHRLRLMETERDQHTRIAVAAERARIARELHDVVAHAVSVIVVQSDGAAYAIRADPELAQSAVRTISDTGRQALIELRSLLDVLRGDGDTPDQRTPQPDIGALPELVRTVTDTGLPVELDLRGELTGLPATVGLGLYRIVQEALTNTLKHAGPGARATVRVERVGGLVEVEVRDDGPGLSGRGRTPALVSGGNGLIGMRERASVLGGTLDAGPLHPAGWRVRATFPVRPVQPAPLPSPT
jgi:signal transduction histidine kinase